MNKSESITIKDIARALNLSYSSVARALKGSYKISEETRNKVNAYAKEHKYKPNLIAQSLKSKHSRSIGVLIPTVSNSFFAEVLNGIEDEASNKNYHVIISQTQESYKKELLNLEHLLRRSIDGVIASVSNETTDLSHFTTLIEKKFPVVFFDRVPDNITTHKIVVDNYDASYKLTTHLIHSNHKNIAHICSSPTLSITNERLNGYKDALLNNNIAVNNNYIKYCIFGGAAISEIVEAVDSILGLSEPPTAIITSTDTLTINCFSILKARGICIPQDIAFAGFSNFNAPQLFSPALTTVVQPAFEMGKTAMRLLLQNIENKRASLHVEKIILPTQLFVRSSTAR